MASDAATFVRACHAQGNAAPRLEPPLELGEAVAMDAPANEPPRLELVNRSSEAVRARVRGTHGSFVTEEVAPGSTRDFAYPGVGAYVVDIVATRSDGTAVLAGPITQRVAPSTIYPLVVED